MKKILLIFLTLAAAGGAWATDPLPDPNRQQIESDVNDNFADALETLTPGLDWLPVMNLGQNLFSASYIGQIYPGFPQFTLGANIGLSSNNASRTLTDVIADDMDDGLPLLALVAADVRLGGYYLPFDIGFSVMSLPLDATSILAPLGEGLGLDEATKVSAQFTALGFDLRYRIIEEGYGLALLPHAPRNIPEEQWWYALIPSVSAGLGYNYYHLALGIEGYVEQSGPDPKVDTTVDIGFGAHSGYASLQVSKKIFFAEPFTGIKLGLSSSSLDLDLQTISRTYALTNSVYDDYAYGVTGGDERKMVFTPVWYWGVGFQLGIMGVFHIQLDLANSYDLSRAEEGKPWTPLGFNLGLRLRR